MTEVASASPPPKTVTAPPPATGPVFGDTADTEGHPSPPWRATLRFWSTGEPRPLAASYPMVGKELPAVTVGEVVVPRVLTSVKLPLVVEAAYSAGPTLPQRGRTALIDVGQVAGGAGRGHAGPAKGRPPASRK